MTRILVFGAGTERGLWDFEGGWVHRLQQDLDEYSWSNNENYSLYNLAVSDHTSEDILHRIKNETKARDADEEIILLIRVTGHNDAQYHRDREQNRVTPTDYRQNISKIMDAAKKYATHEIVIGGTAIIESKVDPLPWKPQYSIRPKDLEKYREQRVEMCNERKLDLIELRPYIDEQDWKKNKLRDGIHPNMSGHKTIYRIVKDGLKDRDIIPEDA